MLSVSEALSKVLANTGRKPPARAPLAESLGLALAEDVISDIDSPPHDKAMVDGYALVAADLAAGAAELSILEEVTAGAVPMLAVSSGQCTRIMTGAPLPAGADAVVMVERTEMMLESARVRIVDEAKPRQNIMAQGSSLRYGDVVLHVGQEIRPAEIGLLAEVGRAEVTVFPAPRVAVLSTGNELVEAGVRPDLGQIRNSNGPLLAAAVRRAGGIPVELGIARDEVRDLRKKVEQGLAADVLVLSGGVSAGVLDLVPSVLQEMGVEQVFHKVNLKPGKPLWFGVAGSKFKVQGSKFKVTEGEHGTLVFGVPGNPVSSLVCFELFVQPAIAKLGGRDPDAGLRRLPARLASEFTHRGERPTYFPVVIRREGEGLWAEPVRWRGSADLRGITRANGLIVFPAGDRTWQAGEQFEVLLL
ncbi:MAG: gephyrin-like molybdotransferase Glp [Pirellulales bacterium]